MIATYRYWPYPGNRHHELRIGAGSRPGSVELVIVKTDRAESIAVQPADLDDVIAAIRAAASGERAGPQAPDAG